jgi:tripartite-type tricarboxylate transporter receptor subunit TctC
MKVFLVLASLLVYLGLGVEEVFSQTFFYQNKTITVILGGPPGGSADMRTKAVVSVLAKHLPGNPVIVTQYMQAGGGRQAANHIYNVARPDGLTIGSMGAALVANAVLRETGVQYDIDKLIYLGTPESATHYIFLTHKDAGLGDIEKLRSEPGVRIGAQSVGHPIYITGRLFAYLLGLREPRFVTGYSGPELDMAVTRREVDARVNAGATLIKRSSEWINKGLVHLHAGIEIPKGEKNPRFANIPDLETFAEAERERKLIQMFRAFRLSGQSFFLPPAVPPEVVQTLQDAMRKTFHDPAFHKEFSKLTGDTPSPLMPEVLDKAIKEIPRDSEIVELFNKIAGDGRLPAR